MAKRAQWGHWKSPNSVSSWGWPSWITGGWKSRMGNLLPQGRPGSSPGEAACCWAWMFWMLVLNKNMMLRDEEGCHRGEQRGSEEGAFRPSLFLLVRGETCSGS